MSSHQHDQNFQNMNVNLCQNEYEEENHDEITKDPDEDSAVCLEKELTESHFTSPSQQNLPEASEIAQTPSTPALVQEVIPANFQNMALSPSGKASSSNEVETMIMNPSRSQMESDCHDSNENNDSIKKKHYFLSLDSDPSPSLRPCSSEIPPEDITVDTSEFLDQEDQSQGSFLM